MSVPSGRDARLPLVALGYLALSLVITWPLARGLTRDVPGDLGDSLLNMWILEWGARHAPGLLSGATSWQALWNANIFHPEPYSLALSEHLFAQALQVAPVYALTGNIILGYNLLFLSTFVVSALGAYLLVRDLTGDWRAAVVAGLVYGFLPYRVSQVPHLQILSSQWMPLALWGVHRYIAHRSTRGLVGAAVALVLQNWSSGYYLLYFAPFVPLFAVHQLATAGRLKDVRAWLGLSGAAVATLLLTLPFLLPYLEAQRLFGFERPFGEVLAFSANVWSYATAAEPIHVWGRVLRLHPSPEGETFLGVAAVALAGLAVAGAFVDAGREAARAHPALDGWRRTAAVLLVLVLIAQLLALLGTLVAGGFNLSVAGLPIRASRPLRLLLQIAVVMGALVLVSPRARGAMRGIAAGPVAVSGALLVLAMWLSLGPSPSAGPDRLPAMGLYGLLYEFVPGFNGLRVPARFAMIAGLFLSVLAGYGAARLARRRRGAAALVVAGLLVVADGAAMPIAVNQTWGMNEAIPPPRVWPAADAPRLYHRVRDLPAGSALAEFPFGDAAWEIRYVYYATVHGRPILNGYSGAFPPGYRRRVAALQRYATDGDRAWGALVDAGATHIAVHAAAFADAADASALVAWLEGRGAGLVERFADGDALYALPPR